MQTIVDFILSPNFLISAAAVIFAVVMWILLKKIVQKQYSKRAGNAKVSGRAETYLRVSANVVKYVIGILTIVFVLQINGINVTSLITGLGIISAIAGLALQDVLKDIIMGTNILSDDFFVVGDIVSYKQTTGRVIAFTVKTTKIEDIYNGNITTVCNRNISEITKLSDWLDIDVPTAYEEDADKIRRVLLGVCERIKTFSEVTDCSFLGTEAFEDSDIAYKLRIHCSPAERPSVRRQALRVIQDAFFDNGITIPYKQIDVHST